MALALSASAAPATAEGAAERDELALVTAYQRAETDLKRCQLIWLMGEQAECAPEVKAELVRLLDSRRTQYQALAAIALGRTGAADKAILVELTGFLSDNEPLTACAAAFAIGQCYDFREAGGWEDELVVRRLVDSLGSKDYRLRTTAAEGIAAIALSDRAGITPQLTEEAQHSERFEELTGLKPEDAWPYYYASVYPDLKSADGSPASLDWLAFMNYLFNYKHYNRRQAFEAIGEPAVQFLISTAKYGWTLTDRRRAIGTLGDLRRQATAAVPALVSLAHEPLLTDDCCKALRDIGIDPDDCGAELLSILVDQARDFIEFENTAEPSWENPEKRRQEDQLQVLGGLLSLIVRYKYRLDDPAALAPPLAECLGVPNTQLREWVIYTANELKLPREPFVDKLKPELASEIRDRKLAALKLLAQLRSESQAVADELLLLLDDDSRAVASAAAEALGQGIPPPTVAHKLGRLAANEEYPRSTRDMCRWAGELYPADPAAQAEQLVKLRNSKVISGVFNRAKWLGDDTPQVVAALIDMLGDPDDEVVFGTMTALLAIGPEAADAVPALVRRFDSNDEAMRKTAIWAVARMGEAVVPEVARLADDKSRLARLAVAECLGRSSLASPQTVEIITPLLRDPDEEIRLISLRALIQCRAYTSETATEVAALYHDPSPEIRRQVPDVLGLMGPAGALQLARAATEHPDAEIRRLTMMTLYNQIYNAGIYDQRLVPYMIDGLEDPSSDVRWWCAQTLGLLGFSDGQAINALLAALLDTEPKVRNEACRALIRLIS